MPTATKTTFWRLTGTTEFFVLEPKDAIFEFVHGEISLSLKLGGDDAEVIAEVEVDTPKVVYGRLYQRAQAETSARTKPRSAAGRVLSRAEVEWFSDDDVRRFAIDKKHRPEYALFRFVQVVRWTHDLVWASLPRTGQRLEWSLDHQEWHDTPPDIDDSPTIGEWDLQVEEGWSSALQGLLQAEYFAEPLAWEIFHQAVALRYRSPRASVVLALSAFEIGTKLLSKLSPSDSERWLALEVPAPPPEKLLAGYLPLLTEKRISGSTDTVIPPALRRRLVEASKLRNKLLHGKETDPKDQVVAKVLEDVHDYLYLLDWISGNEWALEFVSREWRTCYEPPS